MLHTFFYDHPHFPLERFPTTTSFGGLFLNNVVAYYNGISAQFLRNVPLLRYIKYNYTHPIVVFSL